MPYVTNGVRNELNHAVDIDRLKNISAGELNYVITSIVKAWCEPQSYSLINSAIGVLECVKLEFYRRLAAPYEDKKIKEHGDVY